MELDPQIFFQNLTNSITTGTNRQHEALRLLDSFNRNLIEEQIDSSLTDLYLPHFFHTKNCLLNFVVTASKDKAFKKPCMKALDILITILNNFYPRIPEKDILSLYTTSIIFFNSTIDSYIKAKVFELVLLSLEKSNGCVESNGTSVYKDLIKCLVFSLKIKNGDKVKGKEMELIGYLAKKFSFLVDDPKSIKLNLWYNFEVYCAVVQKKLSQNLVAGFYLGFGYYLESFPLNLELADDKKKVEHLYRNLKSLVVLDKSQFVKLGNRAAISFFATYSLIFKDNLLKEYIFWHEKLTMWLTFGPEEQKVGVAALRTFYQIISKSLEENDDVTCKQINQYFVNYCKNILNTRETTNFEKRLAIFCLREFSSASLKHLNKNEVTETFLFIMDMFEKIFIQEYKEDNEDWKYLPEYVQTVANFMRFKKFTASEFFCLQRGVISMIKSFHRLPVLHHFLVIDSLLLTMFYLRDTGYFDNFVENVVFQGVLWSCSHQHVSAEIFSENTEKPVTVKQYFHLWNGILKLTSYRQYDKFEFYLEHRKYILERIINELVKTLMVLVTKLNVSVTLKEEDNTLTDLEKAYRAEETNDYAIFLNVVDFYKNVFDAIEPKFLQKCVCKMIDHLISKSLKYPLMSGFYKLLSYCLKISRQLSLFGDNVNQEIGNCRETLTSFLMVILNKMVEFKDDLLISCLQVLLETPIEVIKDMNILSFVAPFVNVLEVGRSYLPLAKMGVETLEYWQDNLDNDILEPFLGKIIPCLDSFLRSKFLKGYSVQPIQKRRKTMQALKKRTVLEETEPELIKLQRKILCFIGRQSLKTCQNFIFLDNASIRDVINGQSSHLKVTLPYEDLQLDMYLDTFLPRVIELALYSSDRKTRITACELLQACIMVLLGRAKQMGTGGLEELKNMLKTVIRPLLLLSCDIDQVVKQIFEPLFLQLIHWYTSPTQTRGVHTSIIIEAIMEGITHPTNSHLKDFSGKCINEFVKWTLKHQNLDPAATIKVIVKNMRFFSSHPDPAKKLGAALIFNSIYRELREEEKIISIFWLEILHIFVLSLDSILNLEETTTVVQIKRALKHLQRVIIEKPYILRELDKKRRIPNDLGQGVLIDVSKWLLEQTSSRSLHCRESCMELFANITPLSCTAKLSLHEFIEDHLDMTVASLYDAKLITFSSLSKESYTDCASLFNYLRNLLCCLDGYMFIVKYNLETVNFDETVFTETRLFLKKLQNADVNSALNLIKKKEWTFTALDKGVFIDLKSACILAILKLYNAVMHDELLCTKAKCLWNEDLWRLIANITFLPQDLGLNEITNAEYTDILIILLNTIPNKLPKTCVTSLRSNFNDIIKEFKFSPICFEKNTPFKQRNLLKGVVTLKNSTTGKDMALYDHANELVDTFFKDFGKEANDNIVFVNQLQDTTFNYTMSLLKFILGSKDGMQRVIVPLHCDLYVQSIVMMKKLNFGLYILQTFSDVVIPTICENFQQFLTISFNQDKIKITVELLVFILEYVVKDRKYKKWYGTVSTQLLHYWEKFINYFTSSNDSTDIYLSFLKITVEICDTMPPNFQDYLVDYLVRDQEDNHFEIFGLLVKTTNIDITENESEGLQTALSMLNEKIEAQTKNQQIITSNFAKLLTFFTAVKSEIIFEYLIETFTRINPDLEMEPLLKQFIRNLDPTSQEKFLKYTYNIVNKESVNRYKIATNIMPTIFQNCSIDVFEQFFVYNIKDLLVKLADNNLEVSTVHFILVEILFMRIPIGSADRIDCAISAASGKPKLLPELLGLCLNAFKVTKSSGEVVRKYKCHAYNASVSIICNSVKKLGLYEKLFVREDNKIDILWHGIVNTEINYDFPRDFDSLPTQKKILVNIRDELRRNRYQVGNMSRSLQYIESQRLFNSSLSEDVTKFDFTNSFLRTEGVAEKKMAENVQVQREIYLDTTEINNHECMSTICSLIQHMFDSEICQLPSDGDDDVKLPNWMNGIRSLLLKDDTHKNVKIFIVKMIDNLINIFSYYAKWFLEPLIKFVVDNSAGSTINYFVTDVLVILSKWASSTPNLTETEARLASDLLDFFIKNLEKDRQDVFKYNIELLKLIVESWKQYLTVPVDTIFEMFSSPTSSEIAIYVSSVLLVNGLETWERGKEHEFLDKMLRQLDSNRRQTFRACAETLGPLLSILQAPEYIDKVNEKLRTIQLESIEKFAICLEGIAIKFPLIVNIYHVAILISSYNQFCNSPYQQIVHLKIIHRRVGVSLDLLEEISEFKIVDWHELIEDSNLDIQILSLEIIKKCLTYIVTYPDFEKILKTLSRNIYHPNSIFRSCLYDLAIAIYNMNKDNLGSCKELLILGLVDTDLDNQKKVSDFWTENSILPQTVVDRFSFLLSEMYKSKIEDKLLGLATYFLVDLLTKSDKYDFEIFEHPLEDCDFEEYKLQTNWRLQHPSVVPMFAETLDFDTLESSTSSDDQNVFALRQTQTSFQFAPTQSFHEQQLSKYTSLESTLGVDLDTTFKDPNNVGLSQKYKSGFKKRFLKDKSKISQMMAHHETHKKIKQARDRQESAIEREKNVTIYRSYKKGDFPDIQIALSALLKPLQMLSLHDSEISKILFLEIFKGLASKTQNNRQFLLKMSDAIKNIFNSSIQFNQYLFGALLDILLKNKEKITLDSKLISYVAQESGLPSVGALLIEEYIISGIEDDGPNTSKRTFREDNRENVSWIKLAELYKELEEWDTVRAIFLEKMDCKESLQKAITYESKSLYKLAAERYKELIDIDESQNRRDFYYDSYFKCFAHLGEWDKVPTAIAAVVDNKNAWKGLWEDEWYKQKLLPWYITSQVKNQLFTEESSQEFLDDINSALMDSKNSEYINQHFSEELCMLWMCEKDVQTANQYLRTSVKNFLEEWQSLNPIFQSQRFQKLLKLQNVIEISDFLEISKNLTDDIDLTVNRLNKRWLTSIKAPSSSIVLTETILLYRKQFIKILTDKLLSLSGEDTTQSVRELKKSKILMDIDLINKAADLGNFYMTKKHLKPYSNKDNPKLDLAKGTVFALKAKMATTDIPYQVNNYLEALKVYEKAWTSSKTELIVLASSSKFFDVVGDLSQILSNHNKTFSEYRQKLSNVLKKPVNILSDIEKYGLDILKASAEKCTVENMECDLNNDEEIAEKYKQLSKVYIKLAHFVKDKNDEDLRGDFILFVLRAMRMNSSEARQLFPCILMENDLGTKYKDIFTREVEKIPTWMFLGWIPQLLVNVDSSKVFAICDVIQRIAETYPQAIMYPYRLSKDNYNFDNNEVAAKAKLLINRLDNLLLKDEKINQFLKALSYVSVPANVLRYYVGKISNSSDSNITKKYLQSVQEEVFDQSRGSDNVNNMQGNMYKTIEKFKREFAKMLGLTPAKLKELCQNLYNVQLNNMLKKIKPSTLLKDYCPWLANFSANKMNMELEIPGQYDGQKLPLPQHHVKISGFYPEVKIMESIRKPIKITMVGFNTKEYPFLIKFGEDIRQDQRIEQLFCLMNNILKHDATCANNGLDILTYQVIPLTSSLGLIQWINDTEPLSDFIKKSFKDKKETDDFREEYHKFLKIGSNQNFVLAYAMAAEKIKKDKLIVNFKTLVKKIRWDILRESFWSLSVSTENYIALRNNFIKSYAVICVAHWILGIGDRHLSNSLICLRNGKVLGIDFGHAFGTGTQIQGVPELVPFRLTPHIVSLMEPLRERGSFRENMIQCIKCFRDNNASLLATMNVFIQEPSIDWLEHAAKSDDKRNDNWYPLVKIEQARRKLKGASSADIMEEELKANTKLGNYKNVYVKLVRGEENENLRTKFACREDLSVEDQVDCLLDHATDYNLLGRMWNGWYPWV